MSSKVMCYSNKHSELDVAPHPEESSRSMVYSLSQGFLRAASSQQTDKHARGDSRHVLTSMPEGIADMS